MIDVHKSLVFSYISKPSPDDGCLKKQAASFGQIKILSEYTVEIEGPFFAIGFRIALVWNR